MIRSMHNVTKALVKKQNGRNDQQFSMFINNVWNAFFLVWHHQTKHEEESETDDDSIDDDDDESEMRMSIEC